MAKKTTKSSDSKNATPPNDVEDAEIIDEQGENPVKPSDEASMAEPVKPPLSDVFEEDLDQPMSLESPKTAPADDTVTLEDPLKNLDEDAPAPAEMPEKDADSVRDEDQIETKKLVEEDLFVVEEDTPAAPGTANTTGPAPLPPVAPQKSGVSALIGGAIAAVFGFGLAQVVPDGWPIDNGTEELKAQIAAQGGTIESLNAQLAELKAGVTAAAPVATVTALAEQVTSDLAGVQTGVAAQLTDMQGRLNAQSAEVARRIDELERRPIAESTDAAVAAAVDTYNKEVAALRADIALQIEETKALINDSAAKQAQAEAEAKRAAEARALLDVQTAIETGGDFAEPLALIDSTEIPAELSTLAAGVPTLADLTESLPDLARSALQASRTAQEGDSTGDRLGAFMQRQLGLRSLAPKEGDDPDAVLSRVEAAVRAGDLAGAAQQAQALPEPALAILQDWLTKVKTRETALKAADALAQSLNSN